MKKNVFYLLLILLVLNSIINLFTLTTLIQRESTNNNIDNYEISSRFEFSRLNEQNMAIFDTCTGDHWIKWISPTGGNDEFIPDTVLDVSDFETLCKVGRYSIDVVNDQNIAIFDKLSGTVYTRYIHPVGGPDEWTKFSVN